RGIPSPSMLNLQQSLVGRGLVVKAPQSEASGNGYGLRTSVADWAVTGLVAALAALSHASNLQVQPCLRSCPSALVCFLHAHPSEREAAYFFAGFRRVELLASNSTGRAY